MTVARAPKPHRQTRKPTKGGQTSALGSFRSTAFYQTQAEALKAARAQGVSELLVTFRPNVPGAADLRTKISTEELAKLLRLGKPRQRKESLKKESVPSAKLSRAMKEASEVTTFYKTKEELFDALEKRG